MGPSRWRLAAALPSLAAAVILGAVLPGRAGAQEDPWEPAPEAPAPPMSPTFRPWPPGAPFGVHATVGVQLDGKVGLMAGLGVRVHRAIVTARWWVHDGGDEGNQYTQFSGVQAGWFVLPRDWGGLHVSAAVGGLKYRVLDHYVDGSGSYVPSFTAHATAVELEVGVLGLLGGYTNGAGISVAALLPLDTPRQPAGVDLAPPAVFVRLELNPLLLLLVR